ncbi:MAG: type VI secretion system tip protein VgrG [Rubrivivax sp.]|nr:type VI secretion system tip protein VgrG [Rubrivivax sp.]
MTTALKLNCPLPPQELLFKALAAKAGLSTLEEIELDLLSDKPDLNAEKLLGKPMGVELKRADGSKRHFNGICTRFGIAPPQGRYYGYRASVRPWLWYLTRTADCRIFQDLSVPEIVEKVFADHGPIANFQFKLDRSYRTRVYCVQYRETDFNFVARLLEDEGIYWYFEHSEGAHKLVLVDDPSFHEPAPGCEKLPFYGNAGQVPPGKEFVGQWSFSREVQTGRVALTSYDFEKPSATLGTDGAHPREHSLADYEQFDFQGEYTVKSDGQQLADNRMEELAARHERLSGSTNAEAFATGHVFELTRHWREDQNARYLVTHTSHTASVTGYESGQGAGQYACSFSAIPAAQIFRPQRRTPKPFVQGPQTAIVVGPAGEEIFTDKYGRVKVQFHWDRYGKKNEKSSCWVRTSSPWAGKSFGFVQIPRMGQEVVVDFLEGDPDQPLITGRVYNAEQMPPWELPANMTQSGVLSRSTKGGAYGNANALRFEDKKGSEQVWLHAEKNQDIEVENDETHWVGHDRKKTIDHDETTHVKHDRTETVDNNESITIGVNRTESVGSNENITIGANRTESVGGDEKIEISGKRTVDVGSDETITISGNQSITVGASLDETIAGSLSQTVASTSTLTVGASLNQTVGGAVLMKSGGPTTIMAAGGMTIVAPGGTRTIDNMFDKIGGFLTQKFGAQSTVAGMSYQATGVAIAQTGSKVETTGTSHSTTALNYEVKGVNMAYVVLKCEKASFEIKTADAHIIA